jgi:5-methylcytosine-specific restriction endonuclease McrA
MLLHGPFSASLDHIIPYAIPGCPGHVWANVALAHLRCNISKNDRVQPADWNLYYSLRSEVVLNGSRS